MVPRGTPITLRSEPRDVDLARLDDVEDSFNMCQSSCVELHDVVPYVNMNDGAVQARDRG